MIRDGFGVAGEVFNKVEAGEEIFSIYWGT